MSRTEKSAPPISILLNAVLAVVEDEAPKSLCVKRADDHSGGVFALPYGPFDPARHRTFELGLRASVAEQTKVTLGYVEQLYTFGDKGRESPAAAPEGGDQGARIVSVGYLALSSEPAKVAARDAQWKSWYDFFPWEDWRGGEPAIFPMIVEALGVWSNASPKSNLIEIRRARVAAAFGLSETGWEEERALERYELMYEAGLVSEAYRDSGRSMTGIGGDTGIAMSSDHRRILATAIGRLRGKLKYRPVIFELMPPEFTLFALQKSVEAIVGFELHKQNFRRSVENGALVVKTGASVQQQSGRPAALYRAARRRAGEYSTTGLAFARLKPS